MSIKTLDITGEQCPMTFVKTKVALHELAKGEVLEVLLNAGEPLENVPRAVQESGYKVLSIEQAEGNIYKIAITCL
ncbi:MAG: sulfurtransferase TusA family protein [Fibromonadales bacterium]|nr:sulfurtransferase TusA family protein [Fibromonadales bacterium]